MLAHGVSSFAQGISMIAIPWYFKDILDQSKEFSILYLLTTTITLFWSIYAGSLIDKYSRKRIFLVANACGCALLVSCAAIGWIQGVMPPLLAGLVFMVTIFNFNIHYPALYAFAQEVSTPEEYGKVNSTLEVLGQATAMISGMFAALLISGVDQGALSLVGLDSLEIPKWSLSKIFLMDGITYALSFLIILGIKYNPTYLKEASGSVLQRMKEGWHFLRKEKALFHFGYASTIIFALVLIQVHQLMAVYIDNFLEEGAAVFALSESFYAIGALMAGFLIRKLVGRFEIAGIITMMLVTALGLFLCYQLQMKEVLYVVIFFLGITNAGTRVIRVTYLFRKIPNEIIGRSTSVFRSMNVVIRMILIGVFAMPFFHEGINIRYTYLIGAGVVLLGIIPLLANYRDLNR